MNVFTMLKQISYIRNSGKNNIVDISDGISHKIRIVGNNNRVKISYDPKVQNKKIRSKSRIKINICGNNNNIIIGDLNQYNNGKLTIDIGNYVGCDNVNIEIGKHLVFVDAVIYAHQSNVPIKIGDNCLFSSGIVIRSGELPHIIYDTNTNKSIDTSKGIDIGNHVWLGQNVFIMKHVKLAENSIVGSYSVVTKKFDESNVVIAGNPASIRKRNVNWALTKDFLDFDLMN